MPYSRSLMIPGPQIFNIIMINRNGMGIAPFLCFILVYYSAIYLFIHVLSIHLVIESTYSICTCL